MTFASHIECTTMLKQAQETEDDNRTMSREADLFLNKRDGQWEPQILQTFNNRPKYTFDEVNPIVDGIVGQIKAMDFGITVAPGSGGTIELAQLYLGMLRTIQNISKPAARFVFNQAARVMVGTGFDAWRVVTDWRDDDSFQQDLMIQHIPNAQDCVWFDPNHQLPDASDADFAWNLTCYTAKYVKEKYPKSSLASVSQSVFQQAYSHKKPHEVILGEALYKKTHYRDLALMTNGDVYEIDDDFMKIQDELKAANIEVHNTRRRPYKTVYQRMFDGNDWITGEKETVFCYIPIVPLYGNFRVTENKVIYWGVVEKLMDPQRVINYSESRKIEEGALAPRGKVWMTKDQASSDSVKKTLRTMNTNNDPVQQYDHKDGQPPPQYVSSPPSNPNLIETTTTAQNFVQRTSGTYDEDRGTAPPRRSGIAIEKLQTKSDAPKSKWFEAMEIAIAHTFEIITKAIPKVYSSMQVVTLTAEDGTMDTVTIHKKVRDTQTGDMVELNNLKQGKYSITCKAGPAFQTKQGETVAAITDMAQIDPTIMQLGGDIFLRNINAPGMDKLAKRRRRQMVLNGMIPPDELTQDEFKLLQQQQDDMSPIDRANLMIAEAELQRVQGENSERAIKAELEQTKIQLKAMETAMKNQADQDKRMLEAMKQLNEQIKLQAESLKLIREAAGVDVMMSPALAGAFEGQARELAESISTQ